MSVIGVGVGIGAVAYTMFSLFGPPKVRDPYKKLPGITYGDPMLGKDELEEGANKRKREDMPTTGIVMPGESKVIYETAPAPSEEYEGIDNLVQLLEKVIADKAERQCMGERDILEVHDLGNGLEKLSLGSQYTWTTFSEFGTRVNDAAKGLSLTAGLKAKDVITIYAETKKDWITTLHACLKLNVSVATVYATLGPDGVLSALNQTHSSTIVADGKLFKNILKIADKAKYTKTVITIGPVKEELLKQASDKGLKVFSIDDIVSSGSSKGDLDVPYPKAEDTAVIMYTSGTTGKPKGVVISHSNILGALTAMLYNVKLIGQDEGSTYLAYLPLAHIMELVVQTTFLVMGARIGFGTPGTLADISPKVAEGSVGDASALQPTVFLAAPSVLDKIKANIGMKVSTSKVKSMIYNTAMYLCDTRRKANVERGFVGTPYIWNKILFKKVQALLGGNVVYIATGSAPLSAEVQAFAEIAFDCPISQGYGLTETTSCGVFQHPTDRRSGVTGGPMRGCAVKLVDWEEGNYRISDQNNPEIGAARGEVLIGGPVVTQGYYQEPGNHDKTLEELTNASYSVDKDGVRWFHTGDIGALDTKDGVLRIIDRKKDLVKLAMGEYVALSKVENVLKNSPYVEQVMVYALSTMSYCIALVVPNKTLVKWAQDNGHKDATLEEVCKLPEASKEVLRSFVECSKGKLVKFEVPSKVALTPIAWSPDNDLTTAAFKLKRIPIRDSCKDLIDAIYKD